MILVEKTCRLVIIQMWIANVVVILVRFNDLQLPSARDFVRWLPVSFLVSGMLGTSIFALEGTTVSTVSQLQWALGFGGFLQKSISGRSFVFASFAEV